MLIVKTSNPTTLLRRVRQGAASRSVAHWGCDTAGNLTCDVGAAPESFIVRPEVGIGAVNFDLVCRDAALMTEERYAWSSARLLEMLIAHFSPYFMAIEVNAFRRRRSTAEHAPAIDVENLAGDVAGEGGAEKDDGARDVLR